MTAFKLSGNSKDIVMKARLDKTVPIGGFKTCPMPEAHHRHRLFYKPIYGSYLQFIGQHDICIYLLICKVCPEQNVGETGDLRRRIRNNRYTITTNIKVLKNL